MFEISRVQIDRTLYGGIDGSKSRFEIIRSVLDFRQSVRFNKTFKREEHTQNFVPRLMAVVIRESERQNRRTVIHRAIGRRELRLYARNQLLVRNQDTDK